MKRILLVIIFLISLPLNAQWLGRGIIHRKVMAPLKLAVSDNFNRANQLLTTSSNWGAITGMTTLNVVSNAVGIPGATYTRANYYKGKTFSNDQYAEIALTVGAGTGPKYIIVRYSPAPARYYLASVSGYNTNVRVLLYSVVDGVYTEVGTPLPDGGLWGPDVPVVRLEAIGNTISLYSLDVHNGTKTLMLQGVDNSLTSGYPGLMPSGTGNLGDNFYAGDL